MAKHLSQEDLERYCTRLLSGQPLLAVDDHLAQCSTCADIAVSLISGDNGSRLARALMNEGDDEVHIAYDQFESYVDGEMLAKERQSLEDHSRDCRSCSDQLHDLIQLRDAIQSDTLPNATIAAPASNEVSMKWGFADRLNWFSWASIAVLVLGMGTGIFLVSERIATRESATQSETGLTDTNTEQAPEIGKASENPAIDIPTDIPLADEKPGQPVISIVDADSRIEVGADGKLTGLIAPRFERRLIAALTNHVVEIPPAVRDLRTRSGVLMGEGTIGVPFRLIQPVGRIVESDRPRFSWDGLTGADSYVVSIYDAEFNKVAESSPLRKTGWSPETRLVRGKVYQWQVTAIKAGAEVRSPARPAPDARFMIVDAAAIDEIETAKRLAGNSKLLLGITYANAGLIDDAEREFRALVRKNPNSEAARKLLNKVRSAR